MASPDRLDVMVEVAGFRRWIAVVALAILLACLLVWAFFGSLPVSVKGEGLLVRSGLADVQAGTTGTLTAIRVQRGQTVQANEVVATMVVGAVAKDIRLKRDLLDGLRDRKSKVITNNEQEREAKQQQLTYRNAELPGEISLLKNEWQRYRSRLAELQSGDQRILAQSVYDDLNRQILETQRKLTEAQRELSANEAELADLEAKTSDQTSKLDQEIAELEREIEQLVSQQERDGQIRAPRAGKVVEIVLEPNSVISAPVQRILTLEPLDSDIQAVVYVPAEEAKKIPKNPASNQYGQKTRVAPASVKSEEWGFMEANVADVSFFPATPDGMTRVLRNETMVEKLTEEGAPFEVRLKLRMDASTPSGFVWTSGGGPDVQIATGTACSATIEVERKRPVEHILPWLNKTLGISEARPLPQPVTHAHR